DAAAIDREILVDIPGVGDHLTGFGIGGNAVGDRCLLNDLNPDELDRNEHEDRREKQSDLGDRKSRGRPRATSTRPYRDPNEEPGAGEKAEPPAVRDAFTAPESDPSEGKRPCQRDCAKHSIHARPHRLKVVAISVFVRVVSVPTPAPALTTIGNHPTFDAVS